jgi:alanine racemase
MLCDTHPTWAVYDLDRLRANLGEVRRRIGPRQTCIAALKANAYGHGILPVATALDGEGLTAFMTGSFDEARRMKEAGLRTPVVMFAGALPAGMAELIKAGLTPTVVDRAGAEAAADAAPPGGAAHVYVKVDAGLGRLGVALEEAEKFLDALAQLPGLRVAGLYTHLPFADGVGRDWAERRLAVFDALLDRLAHRGRTPPVTQARASCCLAAGLSDRANAVCIGHLLYGLSPFADGSVADTSAYRPVLAEVGSRLVHIGDHGQGSDFAIGDSYGIRHGRRAGVAPVGVAHGLTRPVPGSRPQALIRGRRVPIIAVTLEHLVLDLDGVDDAAVGDAVLLLGCQGDAAIEFGELVSWFGMSGLDTAMALSGRLPSRYLGAADESTRSAPLLRWAGP